MVFMSDDRNTAGHIRSNGNNASSAQYAKMFSVGVRQRSTDQFFGRRWATVFFDECNEEIKHLLLMWGQFLK
jgi:hypothetical protein